MKCLYAPLFGMDTIQTRTSYHRIRWSLSGANPTQAEGDTPTRSRIISQGRDPMNSGALSRHARPGKMTGQSKGI